MSEPSRILAGAMSGTSADGIDVALVQITGRGLDMTAKLLHHHQRPYDRALKSLIFRVRESGQVELSDLARLGREISLCYAAAVNEALLGANLSASHIAAVAAHGQTLYHAPPDTIQWLDPALITAETGCAVVSDFRRADCAAGGQGAPLVPFADYILFRSPVIDRILINIGGIANLTYVPAGRPLSDIVAFDTGPGNCISDWLARKHFDAPFDESGAAAARGVIDDELVRDFLATPYVQKGYPKSTDSPSTIAAFHSVVAAARFHRFRPQDLLALACRISAETIAKGVRDVAAEFSGGEVLVSGGGIKNRTLMSQLFQLLEMPLRATDDLGFLGAAKEAIAFALLGAATLDGVPSNVPSATGAKRAVVLGSVTPRP